MDNSSEDHPYLDLSLLPRLTRQAHDHLCQAGITSLHQFAALTVEELQQIKGIKTTAAALRANALAYVENRPVWFNTLPDDLFTGGWMLDLETAALPGGDGSPWCIGWSDDHGQSSIALVAPAWAGQCLTLPDGQAVMLAADTDALWDAVYRSLLADERPIYHWTGFDAGVLQHTAPAYVRQALGPRMRDLHRTFIDSVRLPLHSYSIKQVSAYFGFAYSGYQEWWAAETDYRRWQQTGSLPTLARACGYQRDDVLALVVVWSWLVANWKEDPTGKP